jgi:hypothetical protein
MRKGARSAMPLKGARYRVKTNPDGSKTRLAFKGGEVVEAKKLPKKKKKKGNEYSRMADHYQK